MKRKDGRALRANKTHKRFIFVLISVMAIKVFAEKRRAVTGYALLAAEQLSATMNTI
jgi:hypothetical protein